MKAVIQRVSYASVTVDNKSISKIDKGLLILLGITHTDTKDDIEWLTKKIANLRIFDDDQNTMNRSLLNIAGSAIVVSQFTLMANTKCHRRKSIYPYGQY